MKFIITLWVISNLFFSGIAMIENDAMFHFEQNQFDSACLNDETVPTRQNLKSPIQFSKFGLSDVLLSELGEKSHESFNMVAEEELPFRFDFNSEIRFEENKFEDLDWSAFSFVPKITSSDQIYQNSDENIAQFNVKADEFVPKPTYKHPDTMFQRILLDDVANQQSPQKRASDYKFWKSKESFPPRRVAKDRKPSVYQNMKYESNGKMWKGKEDLDVLLDLIGHDYENCDDAKYGAIINFVQQSHLKYSISETMLEKQIAILEPLKFTPDKTIYTVLQKNWNMLEGFDSWNRDVFQVASNKIGINMESPVDVYFFKNTESLSEFQNAKMIKEAFNLNVWIHN